VDDFLGLSVGTLVIGGVVGYFIGRWHADSHRREIEARDSQAAASLVSRPLEYCDRPGHPGRGPYVVRRMDCPNCIAEAMRVEP
jgi:hypothetical protein